MDAAPSSWVNINIASSSRDSVNEILPGQLWLGNGSAASESALLQSLGIQKILNVADDVPNFLESEGKFEYFNLSVADFGADRGISRTFDIAFEKLKEWENSDFRVFVHCTAGMNRSATIVIAWLMYSRGLQLSEAWRIVREKRKVCPQKDNRLELIKYEKLLFNDKSSYDNEDDFVYGR